MTGLCIHKNIPVSDTKLTLGLQVGLISTHLTADKLFLVNLRAILSPLKRRPRLVLVVHTDDFGWYVTSKQQGRHT